MKGRKRNKLAVAGKRSTVTQKTPDDVLHLRDIYHKEEGNKIMVRGNGVGWWG